MSKIVLNNIASGYKVSKINANFEKIAQALNTQVLYRDNPEGEPNAVQNNIDMNGKMLINVGGLEGDLTITPIASDVDWERPDNTSSNVDAALHKIYPARKNLGDILDKIANGDTITIACYGDSLTYGQDTSAEGQPSGGLNGSAALRSRYPYPESLDAALAYTGASRVVYNRGYPGDTVEQGYTRWIGASATDVSFIMYGTNDGKLRAVPLNTYRVTLAKFIEREMDKGAVVVLLGPPMVADTVSALNIRPYVTVVKDLASEYGVEYVDSSEQLSSLPDIFHTGDLVHLNSYAYSELGWHLATLFAVRDRASIKASSGSCFYPQDMLWKGGTLIADANAVGGWRTDLSPGQTAIVACECVEDLIPMVGSYRSGSGTSQLRILYAGNGVYRGLSLNELTHAYSISSRQALAGPILRKGLRCWIITNEGATTASLEYISFEASGNACVLAQGMRTMASGLIGAYKSQIHGASLGTWWTAVDYTKRVKAPGRLCAYVTLSGSAGVGFFVERAGTNQLQNMILALRVGNDLVLREVVNGTTTDTTAGGVAAFAAGSFTGELEVELTSTACNVYLNGVLKVTKSSQTHKAGWPGAICASSSSDNFVCLGAQLQNVVKGPYL